MTEATDQYAIPARARDRVQAASSNIESNHEAADNNLLSSLNDYMVPSRKQKSSRQPRPQDASPSESAATVRCPICDAFEGDEAAVSYHVQQHLDAGNGMPE